MKKLLLLFSLLFSYVLIFAQHSRFDFGVSIEAGYSGTADRVENFSSFLSGDFIGVEMQAHRPGYALGLWGALRLSQRWDLQLSANYGQWRAFGSTEGKYYNTTGAISFYALERNELRQDLLRIPLEGRFYFGSEKHRVRPFLQIGIQGSYLLKHRSTSNRLYSGVGQDTEELLFIGQADLKSYRKQLDIRLWNWSLLGGLGIKVDRVILSIQRNWALDGDGYGGTDIDRYYPDFCGRCDFIAEAFYLGSSDLVRQLRQTSLRFSYLLF